MFKTYLIPYIGDRIDVHHWDAMLITHTTHNKNSHERRVIAATISLGI